MLLHDASLYRMLLPARNTSLPFAVLFRPLAIDVCPCVMLRPRDHSSNYRLVPILPGQTPRGPAEDAGGNKPGPRYQPMMKKNMYYMPHKAIVDHGVHDMHLGPTLKIKYLDARHLSSNNLGTEHLHGTYLAPIPT
jgi:hypothetical protein